MDSKMMDSEVLGRCEEMTLALAQASMQQAINASGLDWITVVERFCSPLRGRHAREALSRIFEGDHDLTVRAMGRFFAICGFEIRFSQVPLQSSFPPPWWSSGRCDQCGNDWPCAEHESQSHKGVDDDHA
jgi:hypothetical protein